MAGDLISGLLQGLGQGIQYGQQQRMAQEDRKRQDQMAKMQGKLLELQLQQKQRQQDFIERILGVEPQAAPAGQAQGQTVADNMTGAGNLTGTDNLLGAGNVSGLYNALGSGNATGAGNASQAVETGIPASQIPRSTPIEINKILQDPVKAAALEGATGMPLAAASRAMLEQQRFLDAPKPVQIQNPNGTTTTVYIKNQDLMGGAAFQTGQPKVETFKYVDTGTGIEQTIIRNAQTGQPMSAPVQTGGIPRPPSETASKAALTSSALKNFPRIRGLYMPGGKVSKTVILESAAPGGGFGKGREARQLIKEALDARLRAATGAAVTEVEWPYYESLYLPQPLDLATPGLVEDKIRRLEVFLKEYEATLDPYGQMGGKEPLKAKSAKQKKAKPKIVEVMEDGSERVVK